LVKEVKNEKKRGKHPRRGRVGSLLEKKTVGKRHSEDLRREEVSLRFKGDSRGRGHCSENQRDRKGKKRFENHGRGKSIRPGSDYEKKRGGGKKVGVQKRGAKERYLREKRRTISRKIKEGCKQGKVGTHQRASTGKNFQDRGDNNDKGRSPEKKRRNAQKEDHFIRPGQKLGGVDQKGEADYP